MPVGDQSAAQLYQDLDEEHQDREHTAWISSLFAKKVLRP
jgi:hypothetical protein